jgi:hypothetical protein
MFDKFEEAAERTVTNLSRRQFVGRIGQRSLIMAAALEGYLARPAVARARAGMCGPHSVRKCKNKPVGYRCSHDAYCGGAPNCQCIPLGP